MEGVIMGHLETVRLVRANRGNAERLADISRRAFHTCFACGSPYDEPGGPPGYDSPQAHIRFMKYCHYYEIHYRGKLVGAVMVVRRSAEHCECTGLFVDPDYQNQGIAARAFDLLWERYPEARRWTVGTPACDVRTNHFYPKVGFKKIGADDSGGAWYERIIG
jgi:GNAT superfamily N-acetyltransferase